MRFAVLMCLLASGLMASAFTQPFRQGTTYSYKFRTQVSSSLLTDEPLSIQQQATTGMQAQLKLTFTSDRHARVQLQHVRMGELNGKNPGGKDQMIPQELFEKHQIPQEIKQKLEEPFSVSLVDGVVEFLKFNDQQEASWSKNIKRAAMNMLQLNLKRNDVQGLKMESSMPADEKQRQQNVFVVPEITLEGVCETIYTIHKPINADNEDQQQEEQSQQRQFNVTKNINFNKCQKTADVTYGFQPHPDQQLQCLKCLSQDTSVKRQLIGKTEEQEQLKISQCQKECHTNKISNTRDIERATVAQYVLQGSLQKHAIQRSKFVSQYVVKGQNPAAQNTISQVVAISELVFQKTNDNSEVPAVKDSGKEESLMFSPEWDLSERRFYMWGDKNVGNEQNPFAQVKDKIKKAAECVFKIIKQWIENKDVGYELNNASLFNDLVETVRQSTVDELRQIEKHVLKVVSEMPRNGESKPEEHAKSLILDALATAATRNSMHELEHKIRNQEVGSLKAAQLVKVAVANQHSPSDAQAEILEKIINSDLAQQCPILKQASLMAYSQAIGKICQKLPAQSQNDPFRVEELCPESKKEHFKRNLLQYGKQAKSVYEKIIALKLIGNAALEGTLPELHNIVKDRHQPTLVRMEAIDAMRRMRTSIPEKMQQILLPIFQDQREQPEIRMMAVSMLFYTKPSPAILDQIVFTVQNDRSQNVKSFVLVALESWSKSPVPAEQQSAQHLKAALKIVKITPEQLRASRKYQVPIYVSEQENTEEQHVLMALASIVSPSNLIPVHLAASIRSAFNGEASRENLKLSFSQKDLEGLYEKVLNAYTRYQNNNMPNDKKNNEEQQSAKNLNFIYNNLGIKSRRTGSYYQSSEESDESGESTKQSAEFGNRSPFGMIVIRTDDVDQLVLPINEQKMPQLIRDFINVKKQSVGSLLPQGYNGELSFGKHYQGHVAMTLGETKMKIPTSAGLPLAIVRQTYAIASAQGKAKVEFDSDQNQLVGEIRARISGLATHTHKTTIWTPVVLSGVQSLRTVEINLSDVKVELTAKPNEIKLTIDPSQWERKERIFGLHTLPATFTQKFMWESRTVGEPKLHTIRNKALESRQQEFHATEQLDQPIRIEGNIHKVYSFSELINALYTTENNVHVYMMPGRNSPTKLSAKITGFSFRKSQQDEQKRPELGDFYSSSNQRKPFGSAFEDEDLEGGNMQSSSQANQERESRLTNFISKYQPNKTYKHHLEIVLEAETPSKNHQAKFSAQGTCDQHHQHCRAHLVAQRTPLGHEKNSWQMQSKIEAMLPENIRRRDNPSEKQSRLIIKAETEWGIKDQQQNSVTVRLQGEPTRKNLRRSDSSNEMLRVLNKFDLVADYQVQPKHSHYAQRIFELIKARYFWQLSTQQRKGDQNTIRASLVIDPISRRHVNITVQTPEERVKAEMIELPVRVQGYSLERRSTKYESLGQLMQSYIQQGSAECRADDRRVRTFDGVAYRAPMSECWTVLAKDCSRSNPRFVVMMKKTEDEKKVKIITQEHIIELQKNGSDIAVTIDDEKAPNEETLARNGIEKSDYQVNVNQRGVSVRFDGEEVSIKLSGVYKNVQCGLCGHYSDEEQDVFRMSNNKRSQNLKEFHRSYTLKNQECEEKFNKFYKDNDSDEFQIQQRRPQSAYYRSSFDDDDDSSSSDQSSQWWSSSEEDKENNKKTKPVDRTLVMEYQQKMCFSSQPIKKCPQGTVPDESASSKSVKVHFFCLDRSSSAARQMQRQVRQGQIVNYQGHQLSFFDMHKQPVKCKRAEYY